MASVQEIRSRLRGQRVETLRSRIEPLLAGRAEAEVWLFGSLARGDWDARSDVDLLAVAADQSAADQLAEALLGTGLADDVIGLSQGRWLQRQRGDDPWWRGICRDAKLRWICLIREMGHWPWRWREPWWTSRISSLGSSMGRQAVARPDSGPIGTVAQSP
jgi:hypothetical protein